MFTSAESLSKQLWGFTIVIELRLDFRLGVGYDMTLVMANMDDQKVELVCENVSQLNLKEFGGGINQFLWLKVSDIRDRQLDCLKLTFEEVERGNVSFVCYQASISNLEPRTSESTPCP